MKCYGVAFTQKHEWAFIQLVSVTILTDNCQRPAAITYRETRSRCESRWLHLKTVRLGKRNRGDKWAGEEWLLWEKKTAQESTWTALCDDALQVIQSELSVNARDIKQINLIFFNVPNWATILKRDLKEMVLISEINNYFNSVAVHKSIRDEYPFLKY